MEPTEHPDDPNLRAFDAMMREVFPPIPVSDRQIADMAKMTPDEKAIYTALIDLDDTLCELRDLVALMRSSLAELRHARTKREDYKPWL